MVKKDKQYWININKITIPEDFELHRPKKIKCSRSVDIFINMVNSNHVLF